MRYLIVLMLAGCASQSAQYRWVKPGGTQQELEMASGECEAYTLSSPHRDAERGVAIMLGCMRGKGWRLVER